jgi:hypothetical protein
MKQDFYPALLHASPVFLIFSVTTVHDSLSTVLRLTRNP